MGGNGGEPAIEEGRGSVIVGEHGQHLSQNVVVGGARGFEKGAAIGLRESRSFVKQRLHSFPAFAVHWGATCDGRGSGPSARRVWPASHALSTIRTHQAA